MLAIVGIAAPLVAAGFAGVVAVLVDAELLVVLLLGALLVADVKVT